MKRIIKKISLIFMLSILINTSVTAASGTVNEYFVRVRSGAGTSYVILADDAGKGKTYTLLDTNKYATSDGTKGCESYKWYKISYNNQVGYICSDYLDIDTKEQDNSTVQSINLSDQKGIIACYEDALDLPVKNKVGGSTVGYLDCGHEVEILDTDVSTYNGCYSWYKIKYGSTVGFVCGRYVTTTSLSKQAQEYYKNNSMSDYNKTLLESGFPESYLPYLDELHARYPNWKFEALKTNLDYSTVTSIESSVGTSLIQNDPVGYRSTAGGSYNYYTDKFTALDGTNWFAANHATVSYYMDPRLYLKPNYVFMFEKLTYDSKYHTIDKVTNLLSSTKLGNYDSNFAKHYMTAAEKYNVSPIHLASRTRQEVGGTTSVISGMKFDYNGRTYSGLYNAYNIGAYSGVDNWKKGLIYANGGEEGYSKSTTYNRPWNTLEKAIIGGAEFISSGYINNNQYTDYLQKFNINNGQSKIGVHQYMTNLRAPLAEASSTYNTYNSFNMLNNEFIFTIPVYNNMEKMYVLPSMGNPNNYLKDLKINDSTITGFDGATTAYNVYVSSKTSNIKLSASTVNDKSKISGNINGTQTASGNINIKEGENKITITVTAENGSEKTYTININREKQREETQPQTKTETKQETTKENIDLSGTITKSGYTINNNYISGINPNITATEIINSIKKNNASANITIKNSNGKTIENEIVGTGSIIEISQEDKKITVTVVIYGDASGDGKITALDLLKVQKHILGINKLTTATLLGADSSKDGAVTALDLLKIQKHILGINPIKQ